VYLYLLCPVLFVLCFLYCFVYVYLFLFVLAVLVPGLLTPSGNSIAVNNNNNNNNNNNKYFLNSGGTRWRSWLKRCTTSRKVAGSILDGVTRIFH
jgi:hypothetical protein